MPFRTGETLVPTGLLAVAERSRIVSKDSKGRTIHRLPGDRLQFVNYQKGRQFVLKVGFAQKLKNSTVVLLATGQLQYTSRDGTATRITKVPPYAVQRKMWCEYCANFRPCSRHPDLAR